MTTNQVSSAAAMGKSTPRVRESAQANTGVDPSATPIPGSAMMRLSPQRQEEGGGLTRLVTTNQVSSAVAMGKSTPREKESVQANTWVDHSATPIPGSATMRLNPQRQEEGGGLTRRVTTTTTHLPQLLRNQTPRCSSLNNPLYANAMAS